MPWAFALSNGFGLPLFEIVIRLAIARLVLSHTGTPLGKITTSLGIALFPDHGEDSDALLRAADVALYAAKGAGRDRVVVGAAEKR